MNSMKQDSMVVDLFRHNTWANLRLLEACEGLNDEQLNATVAGTYGSIRDTLWHIVGAEMSYVERATGHLPDEQPKREDVPGFEVLKRIACWSGEELLALALAASSTDMVEERSEEFPGETVFYNLTGLLTQVINHATEHRTQAATILTQRGVQPPEMDGWAYMEAMGEFKIVKE